MKKFFLLILYLFYCLQFYGQNDLKVYSGPFTTQYLLDPHTSGSFMKGNAKYQYFSASDGTRIFEGDFSFTNRIDDFEFTGKGKFKEDKMIGEWVWEKTNKKSGWKLIVQLFFDSSGFLRNFDRSEYGSSGQLLRRYAAEYSSSGIISAECKDYNGGSCKLGSYTSNGIPKGTWIWYDLKDKNKEHIVEYDKYGFVLKSGYRNLSTGDWVTMSKFKQYPVHLKQHIANEAVRYFMRDTYKNNKKIL